MCVGLVLVESDQDLISLCRVLVWFGLVCLRAPKRPRDGHVSEIRLDFICVSCLGFLLRTARRRPISSTLPILLDRDWERDQDCFLGALLRIL